MAVYVDDAMIPFHGLAMNHMLADSSAELRAMATQLGIDHKWLRYEGTHREHFDISAERRALALAFGAISITYRESGRITYRRRQIVMKAGDSNANTV